MIGRFLALTASVIAISHSALAADLPAREMGPVPAYAPYWAGFYAGLNGGGALETSTWRVPGAGSAGLKSGLGMFGAQVGYNWQFGFAVFGVETDADVADLGNFIQGASSSGACAGNTCSVKETWFGSTRARLGYAYEGLFFYGTGGVAYAGLSGTLNPPANGGITNSENKVGWTAGVGIEFAVVGPWAAKLEYLYADLGTFTACTSAALGCVPPATATVKENIFRLGFNHHF